MTLPLLKSALEPMVRRQRWLLFFRGLALAWLSLLAISLILWLSGYRGTGVFSGMVFSSVLMLFLVRWAVEKWRPDYSQIAKQIEECHPDLHAVLLTAIEQQPDSKSGRLNYLQQRVVTDAAAEVRRRNCIEAVPAWKIATAAMIQVGLFILLVWFTSAQFWRSHRTAPGFVGPPGIEVAISPGDAEIERGSGLVVLARFGGEIPSEATLVLTPVDTPASQIALVKNLDDPVFGGGIPEVQVDMSYRVEYAGRSTRDFRIRVFEHPRLDRADATIRYPKFAGLPDRKIADTRRVGTVEGSRLDVSFQLNKPVRSASLVTKDGTAISLTVQSPGNTVELADFAVIESRAWELQMTDADGRSNKLVTPFTLDALPNRRPEMKIVTPRGDERVSPIEEIAFRIDAWDDFGLRAAGISYSIGGGESKDLVLARDSKADEHLQLAQLLKLEEIGVQVDELVSWFAWAEDTGPDGAPRRMQSDIYFAEVRPFEEIYRPGEESSGVKPPPGGKGAETTKLADLQKQIITATWNLKRAEDGKDPAAPSEKYLKDNPVIRDSQSEALGMAQALAEKIEEPKSVALVASVVEEMKRALGLLNQSEKTSQPLPEALRAEQAAYNALLKIAAHEFRVQRNKQSRGKGKQQGDRQRAQLDELEMKDEKKRYETQSEADQPQNEEQKEQLAVLNRLKELAQRQQDINDRVREMQNALEEAKAEKEREEARRQLKRLREEEQQLLADADELRQKLESEQNQSRFAEERKQLERTRDNAQKAAESLEKGEASKALAEGKRAEEGFKQMRDELRKKASGQFMEEMRQMRADARELAEQQQKIAEQLDGALKEKERHTLDGATPREKLARDFEQQQKGLDDVLQQMQRVSGQAEAAEPLLARQLYDALRENSQAGTADTLRKAGELARRGYGSQARQFEGKARNEVENLKKGVERAAESVLGDEAGALRQARAELESLREQLDREIASARPDKVGGDQKSDGGKPGSQLGEGARAADPEEPSDAKTGAGSAKDKAKKQDEGTGQQSGKPREPQDGTSDGTSKAPVAATKPGKGRKPGEKGEGGEGTASSPDSKEGQSASGKPGDRSPGENGRKSRLAEMASSAGGRNPGLNPGGQRGSGRDSGAEMGGPLTGEGFMDWSDRLRNVEEMVDSEALRREVAEVRETAKLIRGEFKRHAAHPNWDIVQMRISKPLAELRDRVGEELAKRESKESLVPIDRDPVPVKYSDRVRRYYEELGRSN